jgi:SAM-dependent methyltransferase
MKTATTHHSLDIGSRSEDSEHAVLAKHGLHRSIALYKAFRTEQSDPNRFYRLQADDAVRQVSRHAPIRGATVFDVGGGVGYSTDAFRAAGALCTLIEPYARALRADKESVATGATAGRAYRVAVAPDRTISSGCVIGDGFQLPFADATADVAFSSNVLEHIENHQSFISELVRVTKPNGIIYLSFTNWYSPWGGHETAPWHYFGGEFAGRRYRKQTGDEPIHQFGESLFPVHVGPLLRWIDRWNKVEVVEAVPRYYPSWCNWLVRVPVLREVATWNLLLVMRKRPFAGCNPLKAVSSISPLEPGKVNGRRREVDDESPYAS